MMVNETIKLSFIGFGNMAKAIARGLSGNPCYALRASAPSLQSGVTTEGVVTHANNSAHLRDADMIILAVKPGQMKPVLQEIKPLIPSHCLIISVAAGLSLAWIEQQLPPHQPLVRSMPNIAASVKQGATPLIANQWVSEKQRTDVSQLFTHLGIATWIDHEPDINAFIALSGSGPAYFFLFLEAMEKAAKTLGLSKDDAKKFSLQTMVGAGELAKRSQLAFSELRRQVTSEKGTTAAAIHVLMTQHMDQMVLDAMKAACHRAEELGKENDSL